MKNKDFNSNIWKYYLVTALAAFGFFTPIIQLFYLSYGLTIVKIAFLGVVWSITKILLEIPSSILADKWGRKKIILISSFFAVLQMLTLLFAGDYWVFVLASIWSAAAFAFISGTNTAFFYDTLKFLKRENDFDKLWAKQEFFSQIPLVIAFISSGFLFELSHLLPFQLSLVFLVCSLIVTLTLKEPPYQKSIKQASVFSHFKESFNCVIKDKYMKPVLLFTLLFSIASDYSYGYGQIYLNQLAMPVVLFGIAYTFKSLICAGASNFAPSLRRRFSYRSMFTFQIISITILLYIMVITQNYIVGAICFILIAIPHGFFTISNNSYIHKHIESRHRATIGSMFSFFVALSFIILEPLFGYLSDIYSIKLPFLLIAIAATIYCVYFVLHGRKHIE